MLFEGAVSQSPNPEMIRCMPCLGRGRDENRVAIMAWHGVEMQSAKREEARRDSHVKPQMLKGTRHVRVERRGSLLEVSRGGVQAASATPASCQACLPLPAPSSLPIRHFHLLHMFSPPLFLWIFKKCSML